MAEPRLPDLALLVVAAFSRHLGALAWAREQFELHFGPVGLSSPVFEFNQTRYYESTMGPGLHKQFLALGLVAADSLPQIKLQTNALERSLAESGVFAEPRPLNLDPGVLTLGKFVLASAKDQAHRVYQGDGIFAEVTLRYQAGAFEPWPWTYADYRQPAILSFFKEARDYYRRQLRPRSKNGRKGATEKEEL